MRQALNNLQSTHNGFGEVNSQNVFKVCDEPHPMLIKEMLKNCVEGDIRKAYKVTNIKYFREIKFQDLKLDNFLDLHKDFFTKFVAVIDLKLVYQIYPEFIIFIFTFFFFEVVGNILFNLSFLYTPFLQIFNCILQKQP